MANLTVSYRYILDGEYMSFIAMVSVIVAATVIATWFNDHVSKSEYVNDEAP